MLAQDTHRVCNVARTERHSGLCTDRLLVNVTPRILIVCTRWSSWILSGSENFVFRLWSVKIISWLFVKLSVRLLASAYSLTLCNSAERESTLTARIMTRVVSILTNGNGLQIRCVYNIRWRTDCWPLNDASWNGFQCWSLFIVFCVMWMSIEKVNQPVVSAIRYVQLSHFCQQRAIPDRVEGFTVYSLLQ